MPMVTCGDLDVHPRNMPPGSLQNWCVMFYHNPVEGVSEEWHKDYGLVTRREAVQDFLQYIEDNPGGDNA